MGTEAWRRLAPVVRHHYQLDPTTGATQTLHGVMEEVFYAPVLWYIGAWRVGIPNWALLGDAVIVESALSEQALRLNFEIRHPWFGKTFGYCGRFELAEDDKR